MNDESRNGYSYRSLVDTLTEGGVTEASFEAFILLEHVCGVSRASVLCDRDRRYRSPELEKAVEKRLSHCPIQYILGSWDFLGCPFLVDPSCLIPRPDTEILAEEAIRSLPPSARAADLCTGSGCIAVSVLVHRPDVHMAALEWYENTLRTARKNADKNGVTNRFLPIQADLLNGGWEALAPFAPFDALLSNPPYIRTSEVQELSAEVHFEPEAALDGGEDGLRFYRAILQYYPPLVRPGGQILLEIGYDQAEDVQALASCFLPEAKSRVLKDLGGRDRVVVLTLPDVSVPDT